MVISFYPLEDFQLKKMVVAGNKNISPASTVCFVLLFTSHLPYLD